MKLCILTQNEYLYLPAAFTKVCQALGAEITCIICAPAMSTHGGALRGFRRHYHLFGTRALFVLAIRIMLARMRALGHAFRAGPPFFSIKAVARAHSIPFYSVTRVASPELYALLDKYQPDLLISISCPQVVGRKIRDRFHLGCINVHSAPLPRYRGLMPTFWVLRNHEPATAVTVHDMADKLDNGAILLQRSVPISPEDTWDSLVRKTKAAGAEAIIEAVQQIRNGTVQRKLNCEEEATYFSFPTAADRRVFLSAGRRFF